jgi:CubicO group peptidase (beta-lactamase class C family)
MYRPHPNGYWRAFLVITAFALVLASAGCETAESLAQKRIDAVEKGLLEAVSIKGLKSKAKTIEEQMQYYRVPGVSIAVLDQFAVAWAKGYGNKQQGITDPVVPDTLFQAGTLTMALTAAAALRAADNGQIDLDGDINAYIKGWSLTAQSDAGGDAVTPLGLLMHTAGISDQTYSGYLAGSELPDLSAILKGGKPASTPLIWRRWPAGDEPRFSQPGYLILQKILTDTSGTDFPSFMETSILAPAGMSHSRYAAGLPEDIQYRAASGHLREGRPLEGRWREHPELAVSGLWTTASDLARFALTLISDARDTTNVILSPSAARRMLTPQLYNQGIAFTVDDAGDNLNFHMRGTAEGYRAFLVAYPAKGQGAVLLTNSDNGQYLIEEILRALAAAYGWPHFQQQEKTLFRLDPSVYPQYAGRYEVNPDYILTVSHEDYYLIIQPTGQSPTRFYVENSTTFFSTSPYIQIQFFKDDSGNVESLVLRQAGNDIEARKIQ